MKPMKWIALVIALSVAACSCTGSEPQPNTSTKLADPRDVVDEALMIALAQAKNFHHKAKVYMADGKPDDAMASVRQILSLQFPKGAPEAEDVRMDARALLAKLLLGKLTSLEPGSSSNTALVDEAMRVVDEGLAAATRESFFVANLHTVKGEIHEARADQIETTDAAKAASERKEAILAFERSIKINEGLQKKLMGQQ